MPTKISVLEHNLLHYFDESQYGRPAILINV
jgi:hypothetical protein